MQADDTNAPSATLTAPDPAASTAELRWYQSEAVEAVYRHIRTRRTNPCVVLPTGAGKSWVIARLCADAVARWGGRVVVLAHRKELLEQNAEKIRRLAPDIEVGVYSAGLRRRDLDTPVVVAGIQSVRKRAPDIGRVDLVIVDEAHLIPSNGEGMYRTFLDEARIVNPDVFVVGLTATPYRLDSGLLCGPDNVLGEIAYESGVRELIAKGFLTRLASKCGTAVADTSGVTVRGGDFVQAELDRLSSDPELVEAACREILEFAAGRHKCLLFASGVVHGRMLAEQLEALGERCGFVSGETSRDERAEILADFRDGDLRFLSNCDVLTTGFDAPEIDAIALLRPTQSPGLYYQMVGRGLRTHPDKENCLVLDYGGNILRHGPVDRVRPPRGSSGDGSGDAVVKKCPGCGHLILAGYDRCPHCGHEWHDRLAKHAACASDLPPLAPSGKWRDVLSVKYLAHRKKDAPAGHPLTLRVAYRYDRGLDATEYVCFEHFGYARDRAVCWWKNRSEEPCPHTIAEAARAAKTGKLRVPGRILLEEVAGEPYPVIAGYDFRTPYVGEDEGAVEDEAARSIADMSWEQYEKTFGEPPF